MARKNLYSNITTHEVKSLHFSTREYNEIVAKLGLEKPQKHVLEMSMCTAFEVDHSDRKVETEPQADTTMVQNPKIVEFITKYSNWLKTTYNKADLDNNDYKVIYDKLKAHYSDCDISQFVNLAQFCSKTPEPQIVTEPEVLGFPKA